MLAPDEFDVAGATTGVVERDEILGPERIAEGDALIAVASSGLHSNGYSLVRHVLLEQAGWTLDRHVDELGRTVGEELLEPTIVYAADLLALAHHSEVHAMCHVTGGGLANNLTRVMPSHLTATIERSTWSPAPIFRLVQKVGSVSQSDIEETLNMGVGMVIALPVSQVSDALEFLAGRGLTAWQCGTVASRESSDVPAVSLLGGYSMD